MEKTKVQRFVLTVAPYVLSKPAAPGGAVPAWPNRWLLIAGVGHLRRC